MRRSTKFESQTGWEETAAPGREAEQSHGMMESCSDAVDRYPATAVFTSLALGFGAGLLLSACFDMSRKSHANQFSRFGHRMYDAVAGAVPDGVRNPWGKA